MGVLVVYLIDEGCEYDGSGHHSRTQHGVGDDGDVVTAGETVLKYQDRDTTRPVRGPRNWRDGWVARSGGDIT